jgi:High potential iron-sulfur protein
VKKPSDSVTRGGALKQIVLPALAAAFAASALPAQAGDNKRQFHYQNKPGPGGKKCDGCRFFRKPAACSVVTGTISSDGWCIAWARR